MVSVKTFAINAPFTRICIFSKPHTFLHERTFGPHETSESGHRNRIILKPLSRAVKGFVHRNPDKDLFGLVWVSPKYPWAAILNYDDVIQNP